MRLVYYHTIPLIHFQISLNSIIRSRFIGYNLSLLKHPFISAAKLQKKCEMLMQVRGNGFGMRGFEIRDKGFRVTMLHWMIKIV